MKILIVDSSYLIYKSYFAFGNKQLTVDIDGETIITSAIFGFVRELITLTSKNVYNYIITAWDSPPYIKRQKCATYKVGREKQKVPNFNSEKEIIQAILYDLEIPCLFSSGYEAEEVASTIINRLSLNGTPNIDFYTNDEDCYVLLAPNITLIKTSYGEIIKFTTKQLKQKYNVTPRQFRTFKILTGCKTDNVKGVAKVGPVNATWLVNHFGNTKSIMEKIDLIEKQKPKIAQSIRTACDTGVMKEAKYLTRIQAPKNIQAKRPEMPIPYTQILNFIDAQTMLKGSNKIVLKFIQKNQQKHCDKIHKQLEVPNL